MDSRLSTLKTLVLDCQATGASPQKGDLLEIGWSALTAGEHQSPSADQVDSYLVQLPEETAIPAAVTRVTGIDTASLADVPLLCGIMMNTDLSKES